MSKDFEIRLALDTAMKEAEAAGKALEIELEVFAQLRAELVGASQIIIDVADALAALDVTGSNAKLAEQFNTANTWYISQFGEAIAKMKSLKEYEASLESVRQEAATALAAARLEVRSREASETDLRARIAELQADRAMAVKALRAVVRKRAGKPTRASVESKLEHEADGVRETAEEKARAVVADAEQTARALVAQAETKLESARVEEQQREQTRRTLAGQIEELEAARTEAEEALRNVAARRAELQENSQGPSAYAEVARTGSLNGNDAAPAPGSGPRALDPPRLRAWQFIAHKRNLVRRND